MEVWKPEEENIEKEDILNGLDYDNVSDLQQMIYHNTKRIEELEKIILLKVVK